MSAFDGTNGPTFKVQFYVGSSFVDTPTSDLREINLTRGRTRPDQRFEAGNMVVIFDNNSGNYDPDKTTGTWVSGGVTLLRDGLRARLVATWGGAGYVLFDGYLETATVDAGFDPTSTMTFVDGLAKLAKVTSPSLKASSYANETTSTRVGRMLTYAKWPTGSSWRSITGSVKLISTVQGLNILDEIDQCTQAESGSFYMSRTGVATFLNLQHKFSRPTQLLFDDSRAAYTVEYDSIKTTPGTFQVRNYAIVNYGKKKASAGQPTTYQTIFNNKASSNKYGVKKVEVTTLMSNAGTASKLAVYLAKKDAEPKTVVESITFNALAMGVLYDDFLSTELQDQVTVNRTTVDGRRISGTLVVEGMSHKIAADEWTCTFQTSPLNSARVILP